MFERMLVGKIENRITVGLISFMLIIVFLGWAAINEGGRMQAFQQMEDARAIEQGAMLFAANCTTCHGVDGRGSGRAPGLNNPMLFGHDFFPDVTKQISDLNGEKKTLTDESNAAGTTDTRKTEIKTRIDEIDKTIADLDAKRTADVQVAVDKGYDPTGVKYSRLLEVGWGGTIDSFILTTLIHGRPISSSYWETGAMPAWSQLAGGPLRTDELENIVAYIKNWDKGDNWTLEDLYAVNQFPILPKDPAPYLQQIKILQQSADPNAFKPVGTDVTAILTEIGTLTGDPVRGEQLYHGKTPATLSGKALICGSCHQQTINSVGPMTNSTYTRVVNERLKEPQFTSYTPEQYLIESIVLPDSYYVPGFTSGVMPKTLGEALNAQDLADIVAYLKTMNQ